MKIFIKIFWSLLWSYCSTRLCQQIKLISFNSLFGYFTSIMLDEKRISRYHISFVGNSPILCLFVILHPFLSPLTCQVPRQYLSLHLIFLDGNRKWYFISVSWLYSSSSLGLVLQVGWEPMEETFATSSQGILWTGILLRRSIFFKNSIKTRATNNLLIKK